MKRAVLPLTILMATFVTAGAHAQATSGMDTAKADDIRELVRMTGGARLGTLTMEQMVARLKRDRPEVPAVFWDRFLSKVNADELVETIVPIYDRHFTHEEIRQLLAFYRTAAGQKLLAKTPLITHETTLAGYEWGRRLGERAAAELKAQGQE